MLNMFHFLKGLLGIFVFAAGFITVFLSAVFLSNVRPGTVLETFGSVINRLGMVIILVGGLTIILAYRWFWLQNLMSGGLPVMDSGHRRRRMTFSALTVWNIGVYVGLVFAVLALHEISSIEVYLFVVRGALTLLFAMCVTIIVWHRGFVRAYAIGLLVGLVLNSFASLATMASGFWQGDGRSIMLINLSIAMLTGLVCAGYVRFLEASSAEDVL